MPRLARLLAMNAVVVAIALISGCSGEQIVEGPERPDDRTTTSAAVTPSSMPLLLGFTLEPVAVGLEDPVSITAAPGIDETFLVERVGRVVTASSGGTEVVLDIAAIVGWDINEQGFLGFAVHPEFPQDTRGFAVYTNTDRDVVVASFDWNGERFDPDTRTEIFDVPQPHQYHQGGGISFGPLGYLWMSFGDGGGVGDRFGNGQNPHTRNGTIVRIDVDHGHPYAIPPTNPFIDDKEGDHAVWAFGLRNPWRFAHDGDYLIIADVGQDTAEEINVVRIDAPGANFGWSVVEGDQCFDADECNTEGFTEPAVVIGRDRTCAIVGGFVYRGVDIPEWYGHYLFGDFCTGRLRSASFEDGSVGGIVEWTNRIDPLGQITTFGLDHDGNVLVANLEGTVSRIVAVRSSG